MNPGHRHRPPRVAEWMLDRLLADAGWHTPLGDFQEFFAALIQEKGLARARWWYWSQMFFLMPKKLSQLCQQGGGMMMNHFKMTFRHFSRQRGYSLINLLGLAVGMTVALLTLLWVWDERSFDLFHVNEKDLFRVVADWPRYNWNGLDLTPAPLAKAAKEALPEILATTRYRSQNRKVFRVGDHFFYESRGIYVDPAFFEMFSFPCIEGDATGGLQGPEDVVITQSMARRYFGDERAVGQVVLADGHPLTVRGVVADPPRHSTLQFDYVQNFSSVWDESRTIWGACDFTTYFQLKPVRDVAALGPALTEVARENGSGHVRSGVTFRLQPLRDIHLDARSYTLATVALGDRRLVTLFTAIALFTIAIAAINFINLSTARAMLRSKEVGLRKTLGARRGQLVLQFLGESLTYAGVAMILALVVSFALLPFFNRFMGTDLSLRLTDGGVWGILLGLLAATGLLAGLYPAVLLSGFRPVAVLKNQVLKGGGLRKGLVVFQFTLAIVLMVGMVTASRQIQYVLNRELGLDQKDVLTLPLKGDFATDYDRVKAELMNLTGVVSVSGVWNDFTTLRWGSAQPWRFEGREEGVEREVDLIATGVDFDFFETLKIQLVEGRAFSEAHGSDREQAVIFNKAAISRLGMDQPVGKWFEYGNTRCIVIGVADDVQFRNAQYAAEPRIYFLQRMSTAESNGLMLIRFDPLQREDVLSGITALWKRVNPYTPFEPQPLEDRYAQLYQMEMRVGGMLTWLTGLALFIASLGLFGLAAFMAQRRTKELGVRKVLGASHSRLWMLLSSQFVRWVAISNLAAWPLGYWLVGKMLRMYVHHIAIDWTLFVLPGVAAMAIALVTVSVQAHRAATVQPVQALRFE